MTWYADRRAKGLCVSCQQPSERSRCDGCMHVMNEQVKEMRASRKRAGLCVKCGCHQCVCVKVKRSPTRPEKDSIPAEIALAISGINTRSDDGYWLLIDAIKDVLDRYGLPSMKYPVIQADAGTTNNRG